jgi:hypothetical protein
VRGDFTTPKSARGSRRVPLAARVSAELDALLCGATRAADADPGPLFLRFREVLAVPPVRGEESLG